MSYSQEIGKPLTMDSENLKFIHIKNLMLSINIYLISIKNSISTLCYYKRPLGRP